MSELTDPSHSKEKSLDPIARFSAILKEAAKTFPYDATACTFATISQEGKPSVRVVLLKDFNDQGFVIYTNITSRKGREIGTFPHAALCFYWPHINVQIRVEGSVDQVGDAEADAYFMTRPRGAQIGAWASKQSAKLSNRLELDSRIKKYKERFKGKDVPRPPFWSGYRVIPEKIEFWTAKDDRLHDRMLYTRERERWVMERLYP